MNAAFPAALLLPLLMVSQTVAYQAETPEQASSAPTAQTADAARALVAEFHEELERRLMISTTLDNGPDNDFGTSLVESASFIPTPSLIISTSSTFSGFDFPLVVTTPIFGKRQAQQTERQDRRRKCGVNPKNSNLAVQVTPLQVHQRPTEIAPGVTDTELRLSSAQLTLKELHLGTGDVDVAIASAIGIKF